MISTEIICPQCGASNGMTLASGDRLCFECRHEWNPDNGGTLHSVGDAVAVLAVDLVLGPPAEIIEAREAQARVDALIDTDVELQGGQRATILGFPDNDHVEVLLRLVNDHDEIAVVEIGDVVRELPAAVDVVEIADETAVMLGKGALMVAGLTLTAALASLEGDGADYRLLTPPTGWAPTDPDALPLFEQGVASAVAALIMAYALPRDIVTAMAETFLTDAQAVTE